MFEEEVLPAFVLVRGAGDDAQFLSAFLGFRYEFVEGSFAAPRVVAATDETGAGDIEVVALPLAHFVALCPFEEFGMVLFQSQPLVLALEEAEVAAGPRAPFVVFGHADGFFRAGFSWSGYTSAYC